MVVVIKAHTKIRTRVYSRLITVGFTSELAWSYTGGKNKNSPILFISPPEGIFGFENYISNEYLPKGKSTIAL